MATSSSALFKPYTDNFGNLTMHGTILSDRAPATPEVHQARINMLIMVAFFLTLIVAAAGLYTADKILFANHDHGASTYAGVALDYE